MPSHAFGSFEYNIVDVDRLIATHAKLHDGKPGKKGLGHITRSGTVMLCAAWELYVEMLLQEASAFLAKSITLASELPADVQKQISVVVRNEKNDLAPMRLAGDGWKAVLIDHVVARTESLNTPKSVRVMPLFLQLLGIADISTAWTLGTQPLDDFVGVRGDIAHRGRHANYIHIWKLDEYRAQIHRYACETDNFVRAHLRDLHALKKAPWKPTQ